METDRQHSISNKVIDNVKVRWEKAEGMGNKQQEKQGGREFYEWDDIYGDECQMVTLAGNLKKKKRKKKV